MTLSIFLDGQSIARDASNIQTKNVISGGFASVTFNLKRSLDRSLLEQFTDCEVFDAATGETVGGGRLMEQGRNDDGTWSITCLGEGLASMQDDQPAYMLIDRGLEQWTTWDGTTIRHKADHGTQPNAQTNGLLFNVEPGIVANGSFARMRYMGLTLTEQKLGGFDYQHVEGFFNADMLVVARSSDGPTPTVSRSENWSTTPTSFNGAYLGATIPANMDRIELFIQRTSTAFTADDTCWALVADPFVMAQRLDKNRAGITGSVYMNHYVTIDQAFTDYVARYCPRLDLANARIDSGTHQYDQIVYFDGVTGLDLLGDLTAIESQFTWQVWEKGDDGWRTELKTLPTTVRYEASVDDGFSAPSPSTEIFNKVTVTGTDPFGTDQTYTATQSVPSLDDAGIVRRKTVSLGSALWSDDNAAATAAEFLSTHKVAPNAGTLTVARPIYDGATGRWVKPWNIRSGELIRVRGVQPTPDTLNATSPDGVTVFRIVSAAYDDDSGAATLELDSQVLTPQRAIANAINWMQSGARLPKLEQLKVETSSHR